MLLDIYFYNIWTEDNTIERKFYGKNVAVSFSIVQTPLFIYTMDYDINSFDSNKMIVNRQSIKMKYDMCVSVEKCFIYGISNMY